MAYVAGTARPQKQRPLGVFLSGGGVGLLADHTEINLKIVWLNSHTYQGKQPATSFPSVFFILFYIIFFL